ncbi:MAG: hypothetical protein GF317_02200 [Candidatus Lokiarchaeota archaeon]|nr:hypothetical protein [Candidatus Lokiarchaeota archaeon]
MQKNKKWKIISEVEGFVIEKKGDIIRALDENGNVINSTEEKSNRSNKLNKNFSKKKQ